MTNEEIAPTKRMIATLQRFGYDLEHMDHLEDERDEHTVSLLHLRERKNNQTALHIAVKKGHLEVLKALSKFPCVNELINMGDRHANTPLHFAVSSTKENAVDMVEFLFSLGASLHAVNIRQQTPLMIHIMTVRNDNPDITLMFVKRGIVLNELINGTTYLHVAIERNLIEIAGALVAGGASINIPDINGVMVSDTLSKKALVKLITYMKEGTQSGPITVLRTRCKLCNTRKGLLETYTDCNLCGRVVCKACSKKASEVKGVSSHTMIKEKEPGRLCTVCSTVVLLREKKFKAKEGFYSQLMGCGRK